MRSLRDQSFVASGCARGEIGTKFRPALLIVERHDLALTQHEHLVGQFLDQLGRGGGHHDGAIRLRSEISNSKSLTSDPKSALAPARRALELADEDADTDYPVERDYVRAHWLLGAVHRVAGELDAAERHLHEALQRCRRINNMESEADILIDLAWLRMATGATDEARRLAGETLVIADRCGSVLQGADAHLVLAQLAQARNDPAALWQHAAEAQRLATCDGPPEYTYQAAYAEALALVRWRSARVSDPAETSDRRSPRTPEPSLHP